MDLGKKLKKIRTDKGYSMEEMKNRLNTKYDLQISKSMISRWENGISEPVNTYLAAYAKEFNLDLNELLGIDNPDKTENYTNIISHRQLTKDEKEILKPFNKLNTEGKDKSIGYTWDLVDSGKYEETETIEAIGGAAAGDGYGYLDTVTVQRTITKKERPSYDVIIPVEGNSMEPTIPDGSLAFVKVETNYDNGKIYVVDADSKVYIKKVYFENNQIVLKSINKDYDDIIIDENQTFRVIGEVVDWE